MTGAALVTSAQTLGVYAIVGGSAFALPVGGLAMLLMAGFVVREATAANPLLGLAVLAAVATARTDRLIQAGHSLTPALPGSYLLAFTVSAALALAAMLTAATVPHSGRIAEPPTSR